MTTDQQICITANDNMSKERRSSLLNCSVSQAEFQKYLNRTRIIQNHNKTENGRY